ncbi:hypothetical protein P5V15_010367 [Pogonomyrmex californicus]
MLGDKKFDVDKNDSIIIDNVRYNGTPGLYELIFKRLPDDAVFTEDDKQTYKSILLTTNAHRHTVITASIIPSKAIGDSNILTSSLCSYLRMEVADVKRVQA